MMGANSSTIAEEQGRLIDFSGQLMSLQVPGKPVPKARARASRSGHYTPQKTRTAERMIATLARQQWGAKPVYSGPVLLVCRFMLPMPISWPKYRQRASQGQPHLSKPDLDNLLKTVKDGLNGVIWRDDSQVAQVIASKRWAETPCSWIHVYQWRE